MFKKKKLIITLMIILTLFIISFIFLKFLEKKTITKKNINKYEFVNYENSMYTNLSSGNIGDFLYFNDFITDYYGEYDTLKQKQIQMPIAGDITDLNFYNGDLYCLF